MVGSCSAPLAEFCRWGHFRCQPNRIWSGGRASHDRTCLPYLGGKLNSGKSSPANQGKGPDSFVSMDVMRLPLGILTGMGFIGAGAILHKENMVVRVTTAATLWFTTVMGFCFGAGQSALGFALLGLGVVVLWCLEWIESRWKQHLEAVLVISVCSEQMSEEEIARSLKSHGFRLSLPSVKITEGGEELRYEVHWRASQQETVIPEPIRQLSGRPGIKALQWIPLLQR